MFTDSFNAHAVGLSCSTILHFTASALCAVELVHSSMSIAMHIGRGTVLDVIRLQVYYFDAFIDLQMMKYLSRMTWGMHSACLSPARRFVLLACAGATQTPACRTHVNGAELGCTLC